MNPRFARHKQEQVTNLFYFGRAFGLASTSGAIGKNEVFPIFVNGFLIFIGAMHPFSHGLRHDGFL
jgi:hypothetical protein